MGKRRVKREGPVSAKRRRKLSPLHERIIECARNGDLLSLKEMCARAKNAAKQALERAAAIGDYEAVLNLIAAGSPTDKIRIDCANGPETARLLALSGAKKRKWKTPIATYLYLKGKREEAKALLDLACIDIDEQDARGKTLLMHAAKRDDVDMVQTLINMKARLDVEDKSGKTVFEYAGKKTKPLLRDYALKKMREIERFKPHICQLAVRLIYKITTEVLTRERRNK